MIVSTIFFYLFSAVTVASAVMVIGSRNPVHSVLFLILAFVNAAGLFVLLNAEFLAMILIVVYVGAVAVLFLFVVMMLDVDFVELRQGFLNYLPVGRPDRHRAARRTAHRPRRLGVRAGRYERGAGAGDRRRQHRGARPPHLHALRLLLPGGGLRPPRGDDRGDRAHAPPPAERQAPVDRRAGRAWAGNRHRGPQGRIGEGHLMVVGLSHYLTVAAILFTLGIFGIFINRKNVIVILMSVELILLAVNINLVAFSHFLGDLVGQVFALLVLTVAAAEAAIGLAILVVFYRNRGSIAVEDINVMKG
jgi:NADH-quinone oxidoreductase subunit K